MKLDYLNVLFRHPAHAEVLLQHSYVNPQDHGTVPIPLVGDIVFLNPSEDGTVGYRVRSRSWSLIEGSKTVTLTIHLEYL